MKAKILVVEDDGMLRDMYQNILSSDNYQVEIATDGQMALAKILQGSWDLILLDIMLPKKDGVQILTDLKTQQPKAPNGPIMMLTNLDNMTIINSAICLGATGYLIKSSMDPGDVLEKVHKLLENSKKKAIAA